MKKVSVVAVCALWASGAYGLSLEESMARVLQTNPDLKSARASVDIADESRIQARAGFMPNVSADATFSRMENSVEDGVKTESHPKTYQLLASQTLFSGGATVAGYKAAKESLNASESAYKQAEQNVLFSLASAYTEVITARKVLQLNQNQVEVLIQQRDAAQRRFELGEVSNTEVQRSKAQLALAQADMISAKQSVVTAEQSLQTIMGDLPEELEWPDVEVPALPPVEDAVALAEVKSPRLIAALASFNASKHNVKKARGAHFPKVTATASVAQNEDASVAGISTDSTVETIGLNVSVPLFSGGSIFSAVRSSQALREQARQDYIQARREVIQEVKDAYYGVETAKRSVFAYEEALKAAQLTAQGILREEELGERDLLDVLDAQQDQLDAEVNLAKAQRGLVVAWYRYQAALGQISVAQ